MNANSKKKFRQMLAVMAHTYQVKNVTQNFTVAPNHAQRLLEKDQESIDFLNRINYVPVEELKGEKIYLGVDQPIASRTDLSDPSAERRPKDPSSLANKFYELDKAEFDIEIPWSKIDSWARFKDFFQKFMNQVQLRRAKDKIIAGWHGVTAAAQTDLENNQLLEDFAKGWLQRLREYNGGSQVVAEIVADSGKVKIGNGGDYANLDEAVADVKLLIPEMYRQDGDLVVILGDNLIAKSELKYFAENGNKPSEKMLLGMKQVNGTFGGLPAFSVPSFPSNGIFVTSWTNLSIYYQVSSVRRHVKDKPERECIQDFLFMYLGYIIENELKAAYIESDSVELV